MMEMSLSEFYEKQIRTLPLIQRIDLARMILNDLPPEALVDYRSDWSEEDLRELSTFSLGYLIEKEGTS